MFPYFLTDSLFLLFHSTIFILFTPSPSAESLAREVKFFGQDTLRFFVGRLFELEFPAADPLDDTWGYVIPAFAGMDTSSAKLDTTLLDWLITDQRRHSTAMITFDESPIGDHGKQIPITSQTTNAIEVKAYLTLKLDTGGLK